MKIWFYRFTAVHFCLTALSGLILYFRPLKGREGWYSEQTKEWLVGLHNGELWSDLLLGNGLFSGIPIRLVLATTLILFLGQEPQGAATERPRTGKRVTP